MPGMLSAEAMAMHGLGSVGGTVLGLAVAVWIVARQVMARRLSWSMMLLVPVLLAYMTWRDLPAGPLPAGRFAELALEMAMALACGMWQGATVQVYRRDGQWYLRGGWSYLAAWAAFLCGDIALHLAMQGAAALTAPAGLWISTAGAAVVWAVRAVAIALREPATVAARRAAAGGRA